jgi:alpha-L-fucosidase
VLIPLQAPHSRFLWDLEHLISIMDSTFSLLRAFLRAPVGAAFLIAAALSSNVQEQPVAAPEIAAGPFASTAGSLRQYQTPDWFRDAKFGIWAHWGPQSVPRQGDWYARNMYLPGHPQYLHHLRTSGHPSEHGYKDIIPLWKAEKWDPEKLMALYAKAGAKYFVSMGVHHDNFDLWDSKFQPWNAVKMGPHRNIVGEWQRTAQKFGLRFGVSEHLGASYAWFAPSHWRDQYGPKAGIAYDGADPKYQDLYHPAHHEPFKWGRSWYATNPEWPQRWFNRIKDLLDQHHPDFLYTDGGIPFEETGRSLIAHFYNANRAAHGGNNEAVYTFKDMGTGEVIPEAGVLDVERGVMSGISPRAWQTDTSIGDWFYSEGFKYKTTTQVVHMLADIVSKNGNLLINVVQYPEGDLPPEALKFLDEMAAWMAVNGEAIHGTRPWKIFGEGPTVAAAGHFKEDTAYTPQDIRFTTKAGALYAITLGVPAGEVRIKSLGRDAIITEAKVSSVRLLGHDQPLTWLQEAEALVIKVPAQLPTAHAAAFQIGF